MPYYVYRISPNKHLTPIDEFDDYKTARNTARAARAEQSEDDTDIIKMIFAKSPREAERLLTMEREPRPLGEELG